MGNRASRLINMLLRALTLGCRFLLVFFLAKFLTAEEFGVYGLIVAIVGYAVTAIGLDFYTYSIREVAGAERNRWGAMVKGHMLVALCMYGVVVVCMIAVFYRGSLPWRWMPWVVLLLTFEYVCQEMVRFYPAIREQLFSAALLFLKQAAWVIVLMGLMFYSVEYRDLTYVLMFWGGAGLFAAVVGVYKFRSYVGLGWENSISKEWVVLGVKRSLPFFVSTLAFSAMYTLDRFWMQELAGLEVVAAYVLFLSIGGALLTFIDAGIASYAFPVLVKSFRDNDVDVFKEEIRKMLLMTLGLTVAYTAAVAFGMPHLLRWIGNPVYFEYDYMFPVVMFSVVLKALTNVPHLGLYTRRIDGPIIKSHLWSLAVFVVSTLFAALYDPVLAVPIGYACAQIFILVWKGCAYYSLTTGH